MLPEGKFPSDTDIDPNEAAVDLRAVYRRYAKSENKMTNTTWHRTTARWNRSTAIGTRCSDINCASAVERIEYNFGTSRRLHSSFKGVYFLKVAEERLRTSFYLQKEIIQTVLLCDSIILFSKT